MSPGDQVKVTDYGVEKTATVVGIGPHSGKVVYVIMKDTGRKRWFFRDNLTVIQESRT